jgi:hypothetical protein
MRAVIGAGNRDSATNDHFKLTGRLRISALHYKTQVTLSGLSRAPSEAGPFVDVNNQPSPNQSKGTNDVNFFKRCSWAGDVMKLSFRSVAILIALTLFVLALALLFAPHVPMGQWGLEYTVSAGVVGRRAGALLAGIAVMFLLARNAQPSPARSALIKGLLVSCLMLMSLGCFELAIGHVNSGILVPIFIEAMITLALLLVSRRQPEAFVRPAKA